MGPAPSPARPRPERPARSALALHPPPPRVHRAAPAPKFAGARQQQGAAPLSRSSSTPQQEARQGARAGGGKWGDAGPPLPPARLGLIWLNGEIPFPTKTTSRKILVQVRLSGLSFLRKPRFNWRTGCRGSPDAVDGAQRSGAIVLESAVTTLVARGLEIGGREVGGCFRDGGEACGRWWRSQRFNLKGSSGVHVFSQCTNHKWEIVSAPPNAVQRNPLLHFQAAVGARAHIPESIKSPALDFPPRDHFCLQIHLFSTPSSILGQ